MLVNQKASLWRIGCEKQRYSFAVQARFRALLMHLLRNTLLSAGSRSKKFFSDSTAYSLNNANFIIMRIRIFFLIQSPSLYILKRSNLKSSTKHDLCSEDSIFISEITRTIVLFCHSADRLGTNPQTFPFGRMEQMVLFFDDSIKIILNPN